MCSREIRSCASLGQGLTLLAPCKVMLNMSVLQYIKGEVNKDDVVLCNKDTDIIVQLKIK